MFITVRNIRTIKELKEFLTNYPDDTPIGGEGCVMNGIQVQEKLLIETANILNENVELLQGRQGEDAYNYITSSDWGNGASYGDYQEDDDFFVEPDRSDKDRTQFLKKTKYLCFDQG